MHITFIQLCGVFSVALGCYALLGFVFPKLRGQNWRGQPASPFIIGACFCFLLGLWAFGIARPYTFVAALVIWVVGFVVERCRPRPRDVTYERDDT